MPEVELALTSAAMRARWERLPDGTRAEAVRAVLDYLAAALGGYRHGEIRLALEKVVRMGVEGDGALVGNGRRASLPEAVLFNASVGNGVELDDGQRDGSVHAGSIVVPIALALGTSLGRSGQEVLEAIVAGYEVMARVGAAINPGALRRSFHTTGICGPLGGSIAAARLLRLSEYEVRGALGTAGLLGAGFMESTRSGQVVKPIHVGRSAEGGLLAAMLAQAGAEGPLEVLSGPKGFVQAVTENANWDRMLNGNPNGKWEIESRYVKPYPTCRHLHASVDMAIQVYREGRPRVEEIRSIKVTTYRIAVRETGEIVIPYNTPDARFSLRYCVANALLKGRVIEEDLAPDALGDEAVLDLARRISVVVGEEQDALYPKKRATVMEIDTSGGPVTLRTDYPKGEPENRASDADLEEKLRQCWGSQADPGRVSELIQMVWALPEARQCPDLLAQITVV